MEPTSQSKLSQGRVIQSYRTSPEYWNTRAYAWVEKNLDPKERAYRWECAYKGISNDGCDWPMPHPAFVSHLEARQAGRAAVHGNIYDLVS
jgi:hypothetical protein